MKQARKTLNSVGWRYALFALTVLGVQYIAVYFLSKYLLDFTVTHAVMLSYLLAIFAVDCIGLPLIILLTRGMEKWDRQKERLGVGNYFMFLATSFSALVVGSILGNFAQILLTGSTESDISQLATSGNNLFLRVLYFVILAPIGEEIIFRKLLIDRLAHRGKLLALLTSALTFALFHGNFSQFFYAFGLGLVFALVYIKTGRIIYSISYHMIVNLLGSVVSVYMLELMQDENTQLLGLLGLLGYEALLYGAAIAGFVLFGVYNNKFRFEENAPEETSVKGGRTFAVMALSIGLWLFVAVCGYMFYDYYKAAPLSHTPVVSFSYEETVVIENGKDSAAPHIDSFELKEDGSYVIRAVWDDGDQEADPGYLTSIIVRDSKGNELVSATASEASMEFEPIELKAGRYTVEFEYITSIAEYREYLEERDDPLASRSEGRLRRELWKQFGKDGEYTLEYTFEVKAAA